MEELMIGISDIAGSIRINEKMASVLYERATEAGKTLRCVKDGIESTCTEIPVFGDIIVMNIEGTKVQTVVRKTLGRAKK